MVAPWLGFSPASHASRLRAQTEIIIIDAWNTDSTRPGEKLHASGFRLVKATRIVHQRFATLC